MEREIFVEPKEDERAGLVSGEPAKSMYRKFIEEEGIPIYTGFGVSSIEDLDLGDWGRLGARGAYLYLDGLDGIKGLYVLEIPGGGSTVPERHLYNKFYLVWRGHGTLEVWGNDDTNKVITEWGPGSLFSIPNNVNHRLLNATGESVLLLAATNAPAIMNLFVDRAFIFENSYLPPWFTGKSDMYDFDDTFYAAAGVKRAQFLTNFITDVFNCELPLDNHRAPGYRYVNLGWPPHQGLSSGFIGQYPIGRYSRAHFHPSGAVLVCLRSRGYTIAWPKSLGLTPWQDGHGDQVRRLDYTPGGLVVAAPGGGDWLHQHFGVGTEPYRHTAFWGGPEVRHYTSFNHATGVSSQMPIRVGGSTVSYCDEDPHIREMFEEALATYGGTSAMTDDIYEGD